MKTRQSTVQFNINTKEIASLSLPVPPIALQERFVDRIAAIDEMRVKCERWADEFLAASRSLQQRAFRGEL
jgi:type I restriction enzyme S subunit